MKADINELALNRVKSMDYIFSLYDGSIKWMNDKAVKFSGVKTNKQTILTVYDIFDHSREEVRREIHKVGGSGERV
jgi:hypothetical protein